VTLFILFIPPLSKKADYILGRRDAGASNGTINRELSVIKKAFNLGIQKRIISDRPNISLLEENNVRKGFFEREQYESIRKHLPDWVKPVTDFAYITGWRKSEILSLQWLLTFRIFRVYRW